MTEDKRAPNRETQGVNPLGVYVPRRFFALKEAVLHLAQSSSPKLRWEKYLQGTIETSVHWNVYQLSTSKGYDPYCDVPSSEILTMIGSIEAMACYRSLSDAREDIREALAENDLSASAVTTEGAWEETVPSDYWRTNDGGWRLVITDRTDRYVHTFIRKADFLRWARNPSSPLSDDSLKEDGDPTNPELDEILKKELRRAIKRDPRPTKSEIREVIRQVHGVSGVRFDQSWNSVTNSSEFIEFRKSGPKSRRKRPKA